MKLLYQQQLLFFINKKVKKDENSNHLYLKTISIWLTTETP